MKLSKERYPVSVLKEMQDSVDVRPEYQRPLVWSLKQKRLLIDSILRGYDVPKMYWHRQPNDAKYEFHFIDGQQRLSTIWEFCNGSFSLGKDGDDIEGISTKNLTYADFKTDLKKRFHLYSFDIVIVEDAIQNKDEDEVREMFLRLQNGTSLKAQEKRNAMTGNMRNFVKDLAQHPFFESCKFPIPDSPTITLQHKWPALNLQGRQSACATATSTGCTKTTGALTFRARPRRKCAARSTT